MMINKLGMILLALALAGLTGANAATTKEAHGPTDPGNEESPAPQKSVRKYVMLETD